MTWEVEQLSDETLTLLNIDGLGGLTLSKLVDASGGLHEAGMKLMSHEIDDVLPTGAGTLLRKRMSTINPSALRRSSQGAKAKLLTSVDHDFPPLLHPLPACPAIMWCRGDVSQLASAGVGIVGSRRCSNYGVQQAAAFTKEIARSGLTTFSGGARGIDGVAHRSALREGGKNVVVLGSGLQMPYPPEHSSLFDEVVQEGGVVISEFPCDRAPRPENFPRRNRIVAGLSSTVLVVEAAHRSGALITARIAVEEHGREVFVIPGRIGDAASAGCLRVLEEGWVQIALEPSAVITEANTAYKRFVRSNCGVPQ
jgi:DNA processing protein